MFYIPGRSIKKSIYELVNLFASLVKFVFPTHGYKSYVTCMKGSPRSD